MLTIHSKQVFIFSYKKSLPVEVKTQDIGH